MFQIPAPWAEIPRNNEGSGGGERRDTPQGGEKQGGSKAHSSLPLRALATRNETRGTRIRACRKPPSSHTPLPSRVYVLFSFACYFAPPL